MHNATRVFAGVLFATLVGLGLLLNGPRAAAEGQGNGQAGGHDKVTLIIKTARGLSQAQGQAKALQHGGTLKRSVNALDLHVIEVPAQAAAAIRRNLERDPAVARVEESKSRRLQGFPNDELVGSQWALPRIAWDEVYGVVNPQFLTTVAILDTGVDATHNDLINVLAPGTSLIDDSNGATDENGHGTWLAGIVAARTNNLDGIAGVAFDKVQVMPVKVLSADGTGQDADIIAGVVWAADHGASVILMAFSNPGFSESLQEAIDYAWARGAVLVAAAGNDGSGEPTFPAGDRGVMGVSATDENDALATGSNFGESVFLAAPGINVLGTGTGNGYVAWSGSSASAAIVAGAAALMRAVDPSLANGVVVNRLARNAEPAGTQEQTGNGRLHLARALADTDMTSIQPAGAAPVGEGGPFVGPYRIAAQPQNVTLNPTSVTVSAGNSAAYTVDVTMGGNPNTCTVTLEVTSSLPAGVTATFTGGANPYNATNANFSRTLTLSTTSGVTPAGSYAFTVRATRGSGCQGSGNGPTANGTLVVQSTSFSINDVTATEGDAGTKIFQFTVTKTGSGAANVDFATANGTTDPATGGASCAAGVDYISANGTLSFASSDASKTIDVTVCGDTTFEPNETFFVNLSNATGGATISDSQGLGTITNDDPEPAKVGSVTVGAQSGTLTYGTAGSATFLITVTRNGSGNFDATLCLQTALPTGATFGFAPNPINLASAENSDTATLTINTLATTPAGSFPFTVRASNVKGGETCDTASDRADGSGTLTINKAATTTTVTVANATYDGNPHGATANVTGPGGLNESLTVTYAGINGTSYGPTTTAPTNAGDYSASAAYAETANYLGSSDTRNYTIAKRSVTPAIIANDKTYDGNTAATLAAVNGCTVSPVVAGDDVACAVGGTLTFDTKDVGTGKTVTATGITLTGTTAANYMLSTTTANDLADITPATATISVSAADAVYTGAPYAGATSCTWNGVNSESGAGTQSFEGVAPTVYGPSPTPPTNAGSYKLVCSYGGPGTNYNQVSDFDPFTIDKAPSTTTVNFGVPGGTLVYDSLPHPATVSVTGAGGLNLSPAPVYSGACSAAPVNVADTPCTASYTYPGDDNHYGSSDDDSLTITPATPTIAVTGGTFTYDGLSHPATATATGIGGVAVSGAFAFTYTPPGDGTEPVDAGSYAVLASFTSSDSNYTNASGNGTITINRRDTTTAVVSNQNPSVFGQAVTFTATVSATGAPTPVGSVEFKNGGTTISGCGAVALVGGQAQCTTSALTVGSHTITADYAQTTNYNASSGTLSGGQTVNKADTTTTITNAAALASTPTVTGQPYTVQWQVNVVAPGAGTPTGTVTVTVNGAMACSAAVAAGQCSVSSAPHTDAAALAKTLVATYSGDGNFNGSFSADASHTVNKADTTLTITEDLPDPSVVNQAYTVKWSVTVNAPGAGTPTGTVTVTGGSGCGPVLVSDGQCEVTSTTAGAKTLTATYSGDSLFNGDDDTEPHQVNTRATTTEVLFGANPIVVNQQTTVTVRVSDTEAAGTKAFPTGTVAVDSSVPSDLITGGPCVLAATATPGVSECMVHLEPVTASLHNVTGTFTATAVHSASSDTEGLTVNTRTTSVTVAPASSTLVTGETTTVQVTVTDVEANGTKSNPKGTVVVSSDVLTDTITGTCTLGNSGTDASTCSVSFKPNTASIHQLTATYTAATVPHSVHTSNSGTADITVNKADTTTTVASSVNPSVFGQSVTFTATVSVTAPGTGTPGGTVQFKINGVNAGAAVAAGACLPAVANTVCASISDSTLAVGSHTVEAVYSGDDNYNGSEGTLAGGQTVNKADTTTTVASSVNPSVFGQSVTFTATVSVTAPGAGTPGGTVQFEIDGSNVGAPVSVAACAPPAANKICATMSIASLTVPGSPHSVTAYYSGDDNYNGSDGTLAGGQTVTPAGTTATVTVSPDTAQYSDEVTFKAILCPTNSTLTIPPGGTVTFKVGTQTMGSGAIALAATTSPDCAGGLTASLSAALLETVAGQMAPTAPGTRQISATFAGVDPNFSVTPNPATNTLTITQEDARVAYTGTTFAWTASASNGAFSIVLSATVQDISATPDAAGDTAAGDIRKATVKFVNRDAGNAEICTASLALVNPADTRTAIATCTWNSTIGSADTEDYRIGIVVNNYYTRNQSDDDAILHISKPISTNFITGGGYLVMSASSQGLYAGTPGAKTNYGFNVKYNNSGKNLQGKVNIIVRSNGRVYQIKSNSIDSLGVTNGNGQPSSCPNATPTAPCKAQFTSKANITDVTDPQNPIALGGNKTLQLWMTDKGEPGSADSFAVQVTDGTTLLYSSSWGGSPPKTQEQTVGGGNLVVH